MDPLAWTVIVLLIVVNALYVAAEFAAVSVRRSQVRLKAQEGSRIARRLFPILSDGRRLDRYIAACQIGITLSSLVLGAFGQATIAIDIASILQSLGGISEIAARSAAAVGVLILLTVLQVVFGELVPKSLALQHPLPVALYTYWPMRWSLSIYRWFIAILNGSGIFLLRLFGGHAEEGHRHIHSPEEIELLIAESSDGGLLEPEEQRRLHHAIALGRLTARQLMVPRRNVAMVDIAGEPDEIIELMINSPYTRLPVFEGVQDNVIGVLHMKDIAAEVNSDARLSDCDVRALLRPVTAVPETVNAGDLLKTLRQERSRIAVVVDEHGGFEGVVTLDDVLMELIGHLGDELKAREPEPEVLEDGGIRLPGSYTIEDATAVVGEFEHVVGVDTVAGLVLSVLGHVPDAGEQIRIDGWTVLVERVDRHAITAVVFRPVEPDPEAAEQPETGEEE